MPILFFILLVLLVAQLGFWNALGAVLGAALMFVILIALGVAAVVIGIMWLVGSSLRPRRDF